jgi:ABC-type hemin transport system ATPase subunit
VCDRTIVGCPEELLDAAEALVQKRLIDLAHNLGLRVVAEGTPREVLVEATLSRVFEWPVAVTTWCDGSPQVVPLRPGERLP